MYKLFTNIGKKEDGFKETRMTHADMQNRDIRAHLAFFGLEGGSSSRQPVILDALDRHANAALDDLYARVAADPALAALFAGPGRIAHARQRQIEHWRTLFSSGIDAKFIRDAESIGRVHARVGLDPVWYVGGYALMLEKVVSGILPVSWWCRRREHRLAATISQLIKRAMFDMQLAISTYFEVANAERAQVIDRLREALERLAAGDVGTPLTGLPPEYCQIERDYEAMRERMRSALLEVADAAGVIRTGSAEIAQASDDLAHRTEEQAACVQQTSAAMEDIAATVRRTAQGAAEVNSAVVAACGDATAGGAIVREAIDAMASIESVAGEISTITGLIDGIAFQTNLLALNAGVEAARAGDAGEGFAVIASEVRALARRSTDAAREISQLISRSATEVEKGVRLVASTGQALDRIMAQVESAQAKVGEIAITSDGQATAVAEIHTAISSIDVATQQNAAMVEQSTAAARSLSTEAESLTSLVGRFSFGIGGRHKSLPAAAARIAQSGYLHEHGA